MITAMQQTRVDRLAGAITQISAVVATSLGEAIHDIETELALSRELAVQTAALIAEIANGGKPESLLKARQAMADYSAHVYRRTENAAGLPMERPIMSIAQALRYGTAVPEAERRAQLITCHYCSGQGHNNPMGEPVSVDGILINPCDDFTGNTSLI